MNDEANETILDIVAEKRREAQHIRTINDTPGGRREALELDLEANRIEAAMKRGNVQRVHNGRREGCPVREGKQNARRDGHGAKGPGKGWRRFAGDVQEDFQSGGNAQSTK